MSIITRKATIAIVKMGTLQIEGLRFEDNGEYAVAVPQICSIFSLSKVHASRDIKAILGAGSQLSTARTTLNPKAVNCVTLLEFERVVRALDKKGNKQAEALADSLVGLALTQLFSDAFGIEFDKHDRQEYLTARLAGKITRRTLTDAIKEYLGKQNEVSENYRKFIYSNCSDKINRSLFGKTAAKLCAERSCDRDSLRSTHSAVELVLIDRIEGHAVRLIDRGLEPLLAVSDAIDFYS
jgi:hypothetical protein